MNPTDLGVLEAGGNMPSLTTMLELADVFGVSAVQFVCELEEARREAIRSGPLPRIRAERLVFLTSDVCLRFA